MKSAAVNGFWWAKEVSVLTLNYLVTILDYVTIPYNTSLNLSISWPKTNFTRQRSLVRTQQSGNHQ